MNLSVRKYSANNSIVQYLDRAAASLMAICPVLQHYQGLVYNAALTVMVVLVPYLLCRMVMNLKSFRLSDLRPVWALVAYMIFRVVDHGTSVTEVGQSGVLIVFFMAVAMGCIDVKWMCRTALMVSCVASVLLVIQYISFFIFRYHIQLVPVSLLLPSADQWILGAQTGMAGITGVIRTNGFYRPSAFFLEPSHAYIYMFPHMLVVLFGKKHDRKEMRLAILLSAGLVLCTSSMGVAVAIAAWGLYLALYNDETQTFSLANLSRRQTKRILWIAFGIFAVAAVIVPPVRRALVRIFYNEPGKKTAIGGRVAAALKGLSQMDLKQWIFGVADTTKGITYNMPGMIAAIYRHGLIGMLLSMEFYTKSMWKLKMPFWLVAVVIVGTSFFSAHTHSTVGMMYFVMILMRGYQIRLRDEPFLTTLREIKNRTA